MAEDVRADALVRDPCPLANAREQQRDAILRQRGARLGEEEVIFPGAAPVRQFLFTWTRCAVPWSLSL